ncbi:DEHA2F10956p [Debaryomyces hansenii CBS767]|uniref:DEHA2F10956p n=1 Tax=Debaryomyces hansenii (strain ATCC 36239 / CBS 767 / BCRC 21394 / JCM 1990 / NBRC 0083 / IGC 2968) TaxID=284592 RepID=Q6BLT0_DEBHA|nr:DEHA2F10956p [Debaryomyces hansenii CBS767]CAG89186.2 DEHA2F10956p [Debaryomyces hansenii CBS767]|eukprot:XP_460841.2 DEHA2F10956p [Debaryomyces hansenii CBS767]
MLKFLYPELRSLEQPSASGIIPELITQEKPRNFVLNNCMAKKICRCSSRCLRLQFTYSL